MGWGGGSGWGGGAGVGEFFYYESKLKIYFFRGWGERGLELVIFFYEEFKPKKKSFGVGGRGLGGGGEGGG